jgi:hypothetical protein
MPIRKIQSGRVLSVTSTNWLGSDIGTIFYDETLGDLRITDGTPGGRLIVTPGSGNSGTSTNFTSINSDIIPSRDVTYNLGSPTHQWRSLYVSTNTIFIGGVAVSVTGDNGLTLNGELAAKVGGGTSALSTASATQLGGVKIGNNINISADGTISVPFGAGINQVVDITDVYKTVPNIDDGSMLVYNSAASRWEVGPANLGNVALDAGEF